MRERFSAGAVIVALLLLVAGCKKESEEGPKGPEAPKQAAPAGEQAAPAGEPAAPAGEQAAPADPLLALFPASSSALETAEALALIPADALFVMVAANPSDLLERLGCERLIKKFANYYEKGVAEVTQAVGTNVLDPAKLPEVGIDPKAPVGLAMLRLDRPAGIIFAGLTDPEKFKTTVYAVAGRVNEEMEPHVVGDATVICPRDDEEACFIVKGKQLFFHFADMKDEEALAAAKAFAQRTPEMPSLASDEGFKKAVKELAYGRDGAFYVNLGALMAGITGMDRGWTQSNLEYAQTNLEEARKQGDAESIKSAEERLQEAAKLHEEEEKRKAAEKKMLDGLMVGLGNVAMGVELGDRAIKLKSWMALDEKSQWGKIIGTSTGTPAVLKFLANRPLYLAHLVVNLPGYLEMINTMLEPMGFSMAQAREMLKTAVGLDLDKDILAALSGEIGLAALGDLDLALAGGDEVGKAFGGVITLGLADAAKCEDLLIKLGDHQMVAPFFKKVADKSWEIPVPEWRVIQVNIIGNQLVITTEKSFIEAMVKGEENSFVTRLDNAEARAIMMSSEPLGVAAMDFGAIGLFFVAMNSFDSYDYSPAVEEPEIPLSEAYQAKAKEVGELKEKVKKMRKEINDETNRRLTSIFSRVGLTAAVGRNGAGCQYGFGGHFIAAESIPVLLELSIEEGIAIAELESTKRKEMWELEDKRWALDNELREIRSQDVQKHHEQKAAGGAGQEGVPAGTDSEPPAENPEAKQ